MTGKSEKAELLSACFCRGRATVPTYHVNNSKHWRGRAAQMRALSEMMKDIDATTIMLRLADDYDILADRADARSNGGGAVHW